MFAVLNKSVIFANEIKTQRVMKTNKTPDLYFSKNAATFYVKCEYYGDMVEFIETDNIQEAKAFFYKKIKDCSARYVHAHFGNLYDNVWLAVYLSKKGVIKDFA